MDENNKKFLMDELKTKDFEIIKSYFMGDKK
jgi:hypothetical protein